MGSRLGVGDGILFQPVRIANRLDILGGVLAALQGLLVRVPQAIPLVKPNAPPTSPPRTAVFACRPFRPR